MKIEFSTVILNYECLISLVHLKIALEFGSIIEIHNQRNLKCNSMKVVS